MGKGRSIYLRNVLRNMPSSGSVNSSSRTRHLPRTLALLLLLGLLFASSSCRGKAAKENAAIADPGALYADDLRSVLREFLIRYMLRIQVAADRIALETDDHKIRRESVRWKIVSMSYGQESSFIARASLGLG